MMSNIVAINDVDAAIFKSSHYTVDVVWLIKFVFEVRTGYRGLARTCYQVWKSHIYTWKLLKD